MEDEEQPYNLIRFLEESTKFEDKGHDPTSMITFLREYLIETQKTINRLEHDLELQKQRYK